MMWKLWNRLFGRNAPAAITAKTNGLPHDLRAVSESVSRGCVRAQALQADRARQLRFIADNPDQASAHLTHHDGYVREAALRCLPDHSVDATLVATVMLRCNDWVPEVQAVARTVLPRLVARLNPDQLAALLPFALGPVRAWGRGGSLSVAALMAHREWSPALRGYFLTGTQGPLARSLRQVLARADLDDALPRLATEARSVFVRSVAAEVVLAGEARWVTGQQWRWIDKPMGIRKREAVVAKREVTLTPDALRQVLCACVADKAVPMRLLAVDHLTRTGPSPDTEPLLQALRSDRADSVRKRMDFFDKRWPTGAGKDEK